VYLIRNRAQRRVKIGFTSLDATERLATLQTGSASPLELVMVIAGVPRRLEGELHQEFKRRRVLGEWFEDTGAIEDRFRALRASNHDRHVDQALQGAHEALSRATAATGSSTTSKARFVEQARRALDLSACGCVWSVNLTPGGPLAKFWSVMRVRLAWDLVPFGFAHDLYTAWFATTVLSGDPLGRNGFNQELVKVVDGDDTWYCGNPNTPVRPGRRMMAHEPLITQYGLTEWLTERAASYRGLRRYPGAVAA